MLLCFISVFFFFFLFHFISFDFILLYFPLFEEVDKMSKVIEPPDE